jgi:hypothetical protein
MPTSATPAWKGASTGSQPLAGQVNQFLGTHAVNFVYNGVSAASSTTLAGTATNTNGLYIAQQFTPGSTQTIQRWVLTLAVTGSPNPLTVTLQTASGGAPSGTILSTTLVPKEYLTGTATAVSIPTAQTSFTSGTQYWIVFNAVGDASNFYSVSRTTAASGVSTSTDGITWTSQGYGIYYNRFDTTVTGNLIHTWEDNGVRWTTTSYNTNATPSLLQEYTTAQATNDYVYSSRTFTYSGTTLTFLT